MRLSAQHCAQRAPNAWLSLITAAAATTVNIVAVIIIITTVVIVIIKVRKIESGQVLASEIWSAPYSPLKERFLFSLRLPSASYNSSRLSQMRKWEEIEFYGIAAGDTFFTLSLGRVPVHVLLGLQRRKGTSPVTTPRKSKSSKRVGSLPGSGHTLKVKY